MRRLEHGFTAAAVAIGLLVAAAPTATAAEEPVLSVAAYVTDAPQQSPAETFERLKYGASPQELGLVDRPTAARSTSSVAQRTGPAGLGPEHVQASTDTATPPGELAVQVTEPFSSCPARVMTQVSGVV
jgi:hypothetical protein